MAWAFLLIYAFIVTNITIINLILNRRYSILVLFTLIFENDKLKANINFGLDRGYVR